jgi:ribosomal-protein-alanine acetyltransferase
VSEEIRHLLIQEIRKRLGPLEATPTDVQNALLTAVTLRGSASLGGEPNLASALARLEPHLRAGEASAVERTISLLRRAVGRLEDGEAAAGGSWPVPPADLAPTPIAAFVRATYDAELKDRLAGIDQCLAAIDQPLEAARVAFRHVHTLKGAASAVGDEPMTWFCHGLEERLREVGDEASARAALIELGQYRGTLGGLAEDPRGTLRKLRGEIEVNARISSVPASTPPSSRADLDTEADENTVRVESQTVARILERIDALGATREKLDATARRVRDLARRAKAGSPGPSLTDELERLAAELRGEGDELDTTFIASKRLVSSLLVTTAGTVFARVTRVIDAEARRLQREVSTRVLGSDESLDRRTAERLIEPCLQIARNAVAHGIEPPDVRRSSGKDPAGTLTLAAKRTGSTLEIRIGDDGAGVDLAGVREHAIRTGALTPERAATADEALLLSLLTRPGFSTQRSPDLLAGRGIGLDIALHGIQKLGGTLRLTTRSGQGLTAVIEVPVDASPAVFRIDAMTEADVTDAASIVLEQTSARDTRDAGTRRNAAATRFKEELGRAFARVRVARSDAELVGYLVTWHVADEVHVLDVATKATARRRGVARALLSELVAFARTMPVRHLLLEVRRSNDAAIHLYRSFGFYATNVRRRYYDDGEDAIEMRLVFDDVTREVCTIADEFSLDPR